MSKDKIVKYLNSTKEVDTFWYHLLVANLALGVMASIVGWL